MHEYTVIIVDATGKKEIKVHAESMVGAMSKIRSDGKLISVTLSFSLCKCCAENAEIFPNVLCGREPYGEPIAPVLECDAHLTPEEQENVLSKLYKTYTADEWRKLTTYYKKAFLTQFK